MSCQRAASQEPTESERTGICGRVRSACGARLCVVGFAGSARRGVPRPGSAGPYGGADVVANRTTCCLGCVRCCHCVDRAIAGDPGYEGWGLPALRHAPSLLFSTPSFGTADELHPRRSLPPPACGSTRRAGMQGSRDFCQPVTPGSGPGAQMAYWSSARSGRAQV